MKFNYVIIYVEDVIKTVEFYQKAFDFDIKFIHESNMYAEMNTGSVILAFAASEMLKMNIGIEAHKGLKNSFEIAFSTDDVSGSFEKALKNGAKELKKPEQKPWGQTVGYVEDLSGTIIEICSPM